MAWRFNPSKFKNTTPKTPKKEETISDLAVGSLSLGNDGIKCSRTHIAFCMESDGGKLGVLPSDARGRRQRDEMKVIYTESINDFAFFPYEPTLLATCSRTTKIGLWKCDDAAECQLANTPDSLIDLNAALCIDGLAPHSTASQILAGSSTQSIVIVDVLKEAAALDLNISFEDRVDDMCWSPDGRLLAAIGDKGRRSTIFDPRNAKPEIASLSLHAGIGRESRIIFTDNNTILSSGFAAHRVQEVQLVDVRNASKPVFSQEYTSATGVLVPLYDIDTKLIFLIGKGTNKMTIVELQDKAPQISPVFEFTMAEQSVGACLGSKHDLDVMNGEVDRVYQLTKNSIVPIPCIVPRRSYRDFHTDLFPNTVGRKPGCDSSTWLGGSDEQPAHVSLDPSKKGAIVDVKPSSSKAGPSDEKENKQGSSESHAAATTVRRRPSDVTNRAPRKITRTATIVGVVSKFRHIETVPGGPHGTFFNLRNVNTRLPTESNGFCVSSKYAAVPLSGPAGIVSVIDLGNICKMPDGIVDGVQNHASLTDIVWDPFNEKKLACALDNGEVDFWTIENIDTPLADLKPSDVLKVSADKIISIRFNPTAADVLAVASNDQSLSVWNLKTKECVWRMVPHEDGPMLCISWSADGRRLVTVGRDLNVCIIQPFLEEPLIVRRSILESPRAARATFGCDDTIVLLIHFTKNSARQVTLLNADTLETMHTATVDTSSQPLVPYYDYDTSVLILTGKGDRVISMFEVAPTDPFLFPLASATLPTGHQSIALQHKRDCDVRNVEIATGWRLTEKTMEKVSFRVPRVKKDLFQSDIFPVALATWTPTMSAQEWVEGSDKKPIFVDLCPEGMQPLSSSPAPKQKMRKPMPERSEEKGAIDEMKLMEKGLSNRIDVDQTLEQDKMEGVDEGEWVEEEKTEEGEAAEEEKA